MYRHDGRTNFALREINITRDYTKHAEGSVLIEYGNTKILCNASVINGVPKFLKNKNQGWLTAEYAMLPRATNERVPRDYTRGNVSGRSMEIQRLISRSLRAAVDLTMLSDYTIVIDCDVIQADGGTRTASITGGCIALYDALQKMQHNGLISKQSSPFIDFITSVSVGIYDNGMLLDLDYSEDSKANSDFNIVMQGAAKFIEIQGTAENKPFSIVELNNLLALAQQGIEKILLKQKQVLGIN